MTTSTIPVQASTGLLAQAKSWAALVRAYAVRMGHNALTLVRQGKEIASGWYTKLLAYIPKSVVVGGIAAWLATKKGYHATVDGAAWLLRKAGSAIGWIARKAHKAFVWTAARVCDLVGLVSQDAAAKVEEFLGKVNCYTLRLGRQIGFVSGVGLELGRSVLKSDTVTMATNIAAGLVLVGVIISFAAPGLVAYLGVLPIIGTFVGAGVAGTFGALKLIALVTGIASGVEIVSAVVSTDHRKDKAKAFVTDIKAAGDPVVDVEGWVEAGAKTTETVEDETEMAMAAVKAASDGDLAQASDSVKAEADAAFKEASAIHGSSKNKSRDKRR